MNKFDYEPIILGAVRVRAVDTVRRFLNDSKAYDTVISVLGGRKTTWELMNFGEWSWGRAIRIIISNPENRLKILDEQRTYLLCHPRKGNNRPKDINAIIKERQRSTFPSPSPEV